MPIGRTSSIPKIAITLSVLVSSGLTAVGMQQPIACVDGACGGKFSSIVPPMVGWAFFGVLLVAALSAFGGSKALERIHAASLAAGAGFLAAIVTVIGTVRWFWSDTQPLTSMRDVVHGISPSPWLTVAFLLVMVAIGLRFALRDSRRMLAAFLVPCIVVSISIGYALGRPIDSGPGVSISGDLARSVGHG